MASQIWTASGPARGVQGHPRSAHLRCPISRWCGGVWWMCGSCGTTTRRLAPAPTSSAFPTASASTLPLCAAPPSAGTSLFLYLSLSFTRYPSFVLGAVTELSQPYKPSHTDHPDKYECDLLHLGQILQALVLHPELKKAFLLCVLRPTTRSIRRC